MRATNQKFQSQPIFLCKCCAPTRFLLHFFEAHVTPSMFGIELRPPVTNVR